VGASKALIKTKTLDVIDGTLAVRLVHKIGNSGAAGIEIIGQGAA